VLTERGATALDGLSEADSVSLDPHKWLYQPFECGCVLVRDGARLRRAFTMTPDYLRDTATREDEVNFADLGMQLTRSARALKLWVSLRYFGLAAFRSAIDRSLDLAELAADRIEESPHLELTAPPSLSIVCLRRRFEGVDGVAELERRQWALIAGLERAGLGLVATTRVRGLLSIRLCILSHLTDARTVERVLDYLENAEVPEGASVGAPYERDPRIGDTWAQQPAVRATDVQALALFSSLSEAEADRVALAARVREAAAGETVVAQWESSRDLFVIVDGSVAVRVDGADVRRHTAGDFFGELAALDWGSGYAYSRLATVVATEPTRLLVFSSASLNAFVQEYPSVGEQVRSAMRAHLGRIPG
jgi:aromatic-L-amino-acid/L-tryptophan decarboxylase